MKYVITLICATALLYGGAAQAGRQLLVPCPSLEDGCTISCVQLDTLAASYGSTNAPLLIELLDGSGTALGTARMDALWGGEWRANLDSPVLADGVVSIRLSTTDDSGADLSWVKLKVLCDPCACNCWHTVYKGCLCDWMPTVEPVIEIVPAPLPEPAPRPRLRRDPPAPAPEPEVVTVQGNG